MDAEVFLERCYRLMNLYQAAQKQPRTYDDAVLYAAEVHALELIGAQPDVTASELAKRLAISKGAVSQTVKKLAEKGLIERTPSADGRVAQLRLSQRGQRVFAAHHRMHEPMLEGIQQLSDQLSPETEAALEQLANLFETHLTQITQEEC